MRKKGTFSYVDPEGVRWLVASTPCLLHTDEVTGLASFALSMLVFSQWDAATATLPQLKSNIDDTSRQIFLISGLLSAAILVGALFLVVAFVTWLTAPLAKIHHTLKQIIERAAEDEAHRDYSDIVDIAWFDLNRSDELGVLATSFWYMVVQLHNTNEARRNRPKHPSNPLYLPVEPGVGAPAPSLHGDGAATGTASPAVEPALLTASRCLDRWEQMQTPPQPEIITTAPVVPTPPVVDGDILSQMGRSYSVVATADVDVELGGALDDKMRTSRPPIATATPSGAPILPQVTTARTSQLLASTPAVVAVAVPDTPARTVFTLKVYLSLLSSLIILGLLAIMGTAIYFLQQQGDGWTRETGEFIQAAEITNLRTICSAKAAFITVRVISYL